MKRILYILVAILFVGCNTKEIDISFENDPSAVSISAQIGVDTRTNPLDETEAQRKVFNTGDQIAVSNGGVAVAYRNAGNTWSPTVEETFLKWEESTMDFTAYYPQEASMNKFVTPQDQSSLEKIATADWMTATAMNQSEGNGAVNFTFQRKMAKVKVVISAFGDQYAPESAVSDVKILGISPYQVASVAGEGKQGSSYTALVNPAESIGKAFFVSLKVNGTSVEQVVNIPTFIAAMSYTYNLRIGKNEMVLTPVSVEDWQSGETINGNANLVVVHNTANVMDPTDNTLRESLTTTLGVSYAERLRSVKITGTMNQADFSSLKGFEDVDLSEVTVVGKIYVGNDENGQRILWDGNAIPYYAFFYGSGSHNPNIIKKLALPKNIKAIGEAAFIYCNYLKLDLGVIQNLKYLGRFAFDGCYSMSGELHISEQLSEIERSTFQSCTSLTGSLTIPANIEHIREFAFNSCNGFTGTLTLHEGLESIGESAFGNCNNLIEDVIIPKSVKSIGDEAFTYCDNIKSFKVLWENNIPIISESTFPDAFKKGMGEKQITIPLGQRAAYELAGWGVFNLVEEALSY